MPILLLLLLSMACLPSYWPEPLLFSGANPSVMVSFLVTWSGVLTLAGAAYLAATKTRRGLMAHPERRERIIDRYGNWRLYHLIALVVFYGLVLFIFGWGWAAEHICHGLPGTELAVLTPFIVVLLLCWIIYYDADKTIHDTSQFVDRRRPFWSHAAYVVFHARQNLALIFPPLALIVVEKGLQRAFPEAAEDGLLDIIGLCLVPVVVLCLPWFIRLALGLESFPEGELRQRLLAAGQRLNFRCSNILLWNTNGGIANAMVAGILPNLRYVLLTDRLVAELTPNEIEAVFGHEVGHVKHHHMIFYMGFMVFSFIAVAGLWTMTMPLIWTFISSNLYSLPSLQLNEEWVNVPVIGILGAYIFVVFGFLSRRCERQADIFGCRAVSCAQRECGGHGEDADLVPGGRSLCAAGIITFINALEKVAQINHISRSKPGWLQSWQHSTIARRVEFLQKMRNDPTLEPRFQRRVGMVKWGLVLGLVLVMAALGSIEGWASLRSLFYAT